MSNPTTIQRPARRFGDADFVAAYGDAWSDTDTLLGFYAADGEYVDKASGVVIKGPEAMRRFMRVYLGFSPDCTVTFTNVVKGAQGFAAEWVWAGKFDGAKPLRLHGRLSPQDGSSFSVDGVSFCTVNKDGQIARHVDYWDSALWIADWKLA